jgi:uncharacterized protein
MSAPGQDRVDVEVLAGDDASLTRRYPLERFARLADLLTGVKGEAIATANFSRLPQGQAACELDVSAVVTLTCQRCLEPFEQPLRSVARLAFVGGEDQAGLVPEGFEAVAADEGRADLGELVEDELLLSLPVVALHGEGTQCAGSARQAEDDQSAEPAAETHRPFAQLQDLLKH